MKLGRKGFTLMELLAVISILSIILLIAVPNVLSIIDKNKRNTYVEDAKKMISLAEYKVRSDSSISLPKGNEIVILKLSYLDTSDIENDPEGWTYSPTESFVAIAFDDTSKSYQYYATIKGVKDEHENRGIPIVSLTALNRSNSNKLVQKNFTTVTPVVNENYELRETVDGEVITGVIKLIK